MSLILDALRKMEQERRSRRGAAVNLRPEVLRYRGEIKRKQGISYLVLALGLLLVAAGGGAGFLVKGRLAASGNLERPAATPANPPQAVAGAEPAAPSPVSAVPSSPPAAASAAPSAPPVPAQPAIAPAAPQAATVRPTRKAVSVAAPSASFPATAPAAIREADESHGNIPDITVSGIAWQEERSLRRAVLNGALVAEGAEVAGARVVEIRENRVRLSRGGQIFDVLFSSGLSSR